MTDLKCTIERCNRPRKYIGGRGWCAMHQERYRTHGKLTSRAQHHKPLLTRLFERTVVSEVGCWEWQGANKEEGGYGVMSYANSLQSTHRLAYEYFKANIPPGAVLDHLCRNRSCLNPNHLEAVTQEINIARTGYHCPGCQCHA